VAHDPYDFRGGKDMDGKTNLSDHVKHSTMTTSTSFLPCPSSSCEAPRKRIKVEEALSSRDEIGVGCTSLNTTEGNSSLSASVSTTSDVTRTKESSLKPSSSCAPLRNGTDISTLQATPAEYPVRSVSVASDHVNHSIERSKTSSLNLMPSKLLLDAKRRSSPSEVEPTVATQLEKATISGPSVGVPGSMNKIGSTTNMAIESSQSFNVPPMSEPLGRNCIDRKEDESSNSHGHNIENNPLSKVQEPSLLSQSATYHNLRLKYFSELEYMLREFQKLERQLLGARTQSSVEAAGSKERREKLHSFILHLEETIQQIVAGCEQESRSDALSNVTEANSNPEESNVQKLDEHIQANLLPVKVRLKRQLAAQQGAKHNPAGMPTVRGGLPLGSGTNQVKATFLPQDTNVNRRPSLLGVAMERGPLTTSHNLRNPMPKNSLYKVNERTVGESVLSEAQPSMAHTKMPVKSDLASTLRMEASLTSTQTGPPSAISNNLPKAWLNLNSDSSTLKASFADRGTSNFAILPDKATPGFSMEHSDARYLETNKRDSNPKSLEKPEPEMAVASPSIPTLSKHADDKAPSGLQPLQSAPFDHTPTQNDLHVNPPLAEPAAGTEPPRNCLAGDDERRRMLKRRRKKKKRLVDQEKTQGIGHQADGFGNRRSKKTQTQRGPRNVEYMCALCNEVYNSTCDYNPWWALTQHDCPKCQKMQVSISI
jgi:hypothetical protein